MEKLINAGRAAERKLGKELRRRFGLSYPGYDAMKKLTEASKAGPVAIGPVAAMVGCSRGNMTTILDCLETAGWITRERAKVDRRVVLISVREPERFAEVLSWVEARGPALPEAVAAFLEGLAS